MTPARYENMSYELEVEGYHFRATFSKLVFNGFKAAYDTQMEEDESQNKSMPPMEKGERCRAIKIEPKQNFTAPPPRFTEASLVKTLEELGIGRPSTYAPTISTILDREYVQKEKKQLVPTELGEIVTDLMKKNFPDIVNIQFTADMEEKLDSVEAEGQDWKGIVGGFYGPFEKELKRRRRAWSMSRFQTGRPASPASFAGRRWSIRAGGLASLSLAQIILPARTPSP